MPPQKKRLGEFLVEKGTLRPEQLDLALRFQTRGNKFLGQILIASGLSSEKDVYQALSELLHVEFINLDQVSVNKNVAQLVPQLLVVTRDILPIYVEDNHLYLVMENPRDFDVIQIVEFSTHRQVKPLIATPSQLQKMIQHLYGNHAGRSEHFSPEGLERLGLSSPLLESYRSLLRSEQGMIIVTGPSMPENEKTTTLYATLKALCADPVKNIVTIEESIKYRLPGVKQISLNEEKGLTCHSVLSLLSGHDPNIMRDPNVIMVSDLRDAETAQIMMRLSETGHLLLTALDCENAVTALSHLYTLGLSAKILTSNLLGVITQHMVRALCSECKQPSLATTEELRSLGLPLQEPSSAFNVYRAKGCQACQYTGYQGQVSLYELFVPDEQCRNNMMRRLPRHQLNRLAEQMGMKTLLADGIEKIQQGITTPDEVIGACCRKCGGCGKPLIPSAENCPFCQYRRFECCETCGAQLDLEWLLCPYCGTRK